MPITPAQSSPQSQKFADTATPFDNTLGVVDTAEDLVAVPVLKKGRAISLINDGPGDVALAFDATATLTGLVLHEGEAYSDNGLEISTKVSFINVTPANLPVVRGVLWSGPA